MDYPADPACRSVDDQWLLGEDLLVAPVLTGQRTRRVVLPAGLWRPLVGGGPIAGGQVVEVDAPLDLLPVYVRDGAVLPLADPVDQVGPDTLFRLRVQVHGDGRHGAELVEDDGVTMAGPANRIGLTWDGSRVHLSRAGSFAGRRYELASWEQRA
jgi:alpha-D-xyloside xylohydrolase